MTIERVAVVMTTYFPAGEDGSRRVRYANAALASLLHGLRSPVPLTLVIADDGSAEDHHAERAALAMPRRGATRAKWEPGYVVTGPNAGIGASLNRALDMLEREWGPDGWAWMYTTDDWALTASDGLDLALPLWLASEEYCYDIVRLGIAHPGLQCKTMFREGRGWWLEVDLAAGGFGFATRPALFTPRLRRVAGRFDEGVNSYDMERCYAERVSHNVPKLFAAIVAESLNTTWEHLAEGDPSIGAREIVAAV